MTVSGTSVQGFNDLTAKWTAALAAAAQVPASYVTISNGGWPPERLSCLAGARNSLTG